MPKDNEVGEKNKAEEKIAQLGSQLHDEWRASRYREDLKDYEPRVKKTTDPLWQIAHDGKTEVDIANTSYGDLPEDWKGENKASAEVTVTEIEKAVQAGVELDDAFVENASSVLHDKWLERNGSWAPTEQKKPYAELSEEEKEKDRVIIRKGIEMYKSKEK